MNPRYTSMTLQLTIFTGARHMLAITPTCTHASIITCSSLPDRPENYSASPWSSRLGEVVFLDRFYTMDLSFPRTSSRGLTDGKAQGSSDPTTSWSHNPAVMHSCLVSSWSSGNHCC